MIRAEDSQVINRSEFASTVESGMVLEMSIVVQQDIAFEDNKKCPRCGHVSLNLAGNGWIEWKVSPNFVHFDPNFAYSRKCAGQIKITEDDQIGEDGDGAIISPAVYVIQVFVCIIVRDEYYSHGGTTANTGGRGLDENRRHDEDDGTQFFRRIHLISPKRRRVIKNKILAVGRMARVFALLRYVLLLRIYVYLICVVHNKGRVRESV